MTRIATPISHLYKDAAAAIAITAASDCLECRDHSPAETHLELHRLFHFEQQIIHPMTDEDFDYIRRCCESKPHLELVSFHIASCYDQPVIVEGQFQPGGKRYERQELLDIAAKNIARLRTFLSPAIIICVENNNYLRTPAYDHVIEAGFLRDVVEQNQIHFLYDIAHAHISAVNMRIPFQQYYNELPIHRTRQVHICKFGMRSEDEAYDAHFPPDDFIFSELKKVLQTASVDFVTVEYYRELPGLLQSLQSLKEIL
ncbi:MAG: DUF692 family protein [Chitinophagales bacterium]